MRTLLDIKPIMLARRSVHRIENGKGAEVFCLSGTVWLTQEGDRRDVILGAGQSFLLDRQGVAIAYALKDSSITVGVPGHIAPAPESRHAA